ncbi:alpha/beta fold hydrolase [Glycomyces algeriensis]|uniref:Hydrolase n=1 Tax=Glycomyces algeriensis TaxID=256037 RepID=A0A9W6G7P6_9ACTN|nr:alpha/beta hydrolase [Glycomyces algeriensis]MDA1364926.1 alpha/beta hydrolase [Glycomyces algeriensis]MDR7350014.1 pimeloyl-ACP methyl ester carboxylesterase [Glycomyces algeriensis]GLI42725.1 hydrolase [Glycomyces algeriensis]
MTEPHHHTLEAPGAVLHYDVRDGSGPALLLIGSPMAAAGFTTLAGHFTDRRVVTYDPRGSERSVRTDGGAQNTVEEHVDDLRRVIEAVGGGPVDVFASSGGAVNALALVARHPDLVGTLVAHEPPASAELPDAAVILKVCEDTRDTYLAHGFGPAMAKFIALVSHQGPFDEAYLERPAPDPAAFGLPTEDDGDRSDPLLGLNMVTCNAYRHDFAALCAASTRIVLGVGADSGEILPARAAEVVAGELGTATVAFPGDHGGFLGGEYGQTGKPDEFAAKLREVLEA